MSKVPTGIPNLSGEEKQQLAAALSETSKSMARMTGEREYIREVVK